MITIVIAFILLASFFVVESRIRQGEDAKSLARGDADRGSTMLIGAAFGIGMSALFAAVLLGYFQLLRLPYADLVGWGGVIVMLAGLALRIWATRVLGRFYTRTLRVQQQQRVVREGPYSVVRHPGYLGTILLWIGAGLATANWFALIAIALVMLVAYTRRIQAEDAMLIATLGEEYKEYAARTRRLIPFVY